MDVLNAKEELGYQPVFDVHKLFEEFRKEMQVDRFLELREDKSWKRGIDMKTVIIAEAGVNHNGDMDIAKD